MSENAILGQLAAKVAGGSLIVFLGSVTAQLVKLLSALVIVGFIGASGFGMYALGLSLIGIASTVAMLGLEHGTVRFVALHRGNEDASRVKGTIIQAFSFSTLFSILVAIVLVASSRYLAAEVFKKPHLVTVFRLFSICLPLYVFMLMCAAAIRGSANMKCYELVKDIGFHCSYLLLLLIALLVGLGVRGAIYAFFLSSVLSGLLGVYFVSRIFPCIIRAQRPSYNAKTLLSFSFPALFVASSYVLLHHTDKIMLGYFASTSTVGVYATAFRLAMLLKLVFTAFNGILAPILPDLHGRGEMKQLAFVYKNSTRWMFALTFPIFLVVVLFARQIMGLFGHDFVQGYMVLIILSSAYLLNAATGPVCFMLLMSGKQNLELIDDLSMVAVNILLNIWLIGAYGSVGAAIATGASLVLMNLIKVVQVMVLFKMVPYDLRFLKPAAIGTVMLVALFTFCSKLIVTVPTMIVGAIVIPVAYLFIYRILGLGKEERIALTAITREFTRRREQHQYAAS